MKRILALMLLVVSVASGQYTGDRRTQSIWYVAQQDTTISAARGFYPLQVGRYVPFEFGRPTAGRPYWNFNTHKNATQANDIVLSMFHNLTYDSTAGNYSNSKPFPGIGAFAMQWESHYDSAMEWNANLWAASENPAGGFYRRIFHMNAYNSAVPTSGIVPGMVTWRWWTGRHGQFAVGYDQGGPLYSSGGNIDSTKFSFFGRGDDVGQMMRNYNDSGSTSVLLADSGFGYLKLQQFGTRRQDSLYGIPLNGQSASRIINFGFGDLFLGTNSDKHIYFHNDGSLSGELGTGGLGLYRQSFYWYAYNPLLQMTDSFDASRTMLFGVYGDQGLFTTRYTYDIHLWPRYNSSGGKVLIGDSTGSGFLTATTNVNGSLKALTTIAAGNLTADSSVTGVGAHFTGGGRFDGPVTASNTIGSSSTDNHLVRAVTPDSLADGPIYVDANTDTAATRAYARAQAAPKMDSTRVNTLLDLKAPLASPTFSGQVQARNNISDYASESQYPLSAGMSTATRRVIIGFHDGTSRGVIAAIDDGVAWRGLWFNPNGGQADFGGPIASTQFKLSALNAAPVNASDTGTLGEIRIDASFIYVCTATNTWVRAAISTW